MTEIKRTKPNPIPTREEFHREFAGSISMGDFDTEKRTEHAYLCGYMIKTEAEREYRQRFYKKYGYR